MSLLYSQLQEKLNGRLYNGYFHCCCPFPHFGHLEENPSFFVYEDNRYRCASCGKHGSLEFLNRYIGGHEVKIHRGKSQVLPAWRKWEQLYGDLEGIAEHAHEVCKKFPSEMWYFKQRGISQFFEPGMFGRIDNFCLFPVFNENRKIVSIVMRYTGNNKNNTRYVTHQTVDGKQYLYIPNRERVNNSDYVVVCYGLVDAWSFEDIGIPVITGCVGKFSSPELLKSINKKIYIVPDYGESRDAHILANALGWRGKVINLSFPGECKDADDIRMNYGKETLLSMVMERIS